MLNLQRVLKYSDLDECIFKGILLQNQIRWVPRFLHFYSIIKWELHVFFLSCTMTGIKSTCLLSSCFEFHFWGRDLHILTWYICLHVWKKKPWDLLLFHFIPYFTHAFFSLLALAFRVLRCKQTQWILKEWIQSVQDHLQVRLRDYAIRNNT